MKKNLIILFIVSALAIIAFILSGTSRTGTFTKGENDFAVEDTAGITKIFMVDKKNRSVLLERIAGGNWMLNKEYHARKTGTDLLLYTIHHMIAKAPVPKTGRDNVIALLATQSVKVEVYQKVFRINLFGKLKYFPHEKRTKTFYVGSATQNNQGTFMLMEGADNPFVVHLLGFRGFVAPRFSTLEEDWRDHTVFRKKIHEIKSVVVEFMEEPEKSVEILSDGNDFAVVKRATNDTLRNYDTLNLYNFLTAFSDLRYEALLNDMDPDRKDSIINTSAFHRVTLTDRDNHKTVIKTFHKPNDMQRYDMEGRLYTHDLDRLYALINDDRDFVLIQFFVFDKVLRPLDYFVTER
ncbi:MAG: DUF4340 domain-containing protein [Bacteroidales bacterium]|nr:DUF4340 domain-containing protein [Bacteroidales bacterium]